MELDNKVALVLGAIKGIGREIGLALARQGVRVALTYYDWEESLEGMRRDFAAAGKEPLVLRVDLRDTEAVSGMMDQIIRRFGRLDILINNIERGGWPVVHGPYTRQQWDLEMETTLRAKKWVFEAALPWLQKSDDACVINFSSIAGVVGRSGPASYVFNEGYSLANLGISLLTETWARIGAPKIRVNEIMLGFFETRHGEKTRGWGLLTDGQKQAILDHTLLGRTGKIPDVVRMVLFILKDAPFMTGSVIRLDGGYCIGGEQVAPMPSGVE
ncbi:MAG: 3-oxoacyl-ACP reductase [Desulfobacterales bacterium CG23_combo_of_CG06-09_8_20_14_all_51_8]|nr:MAG: 3-oxoacyl-ACP reductase [Desulfobacterales bacterium CG23_combo_of_CG06-09_8_20_14_all_51_8]